MILDWLALHYSLEMLISLLLGTNLVITLLFYNYENTVGMKEWRAGIFVLEIQEISDHLVLPFLNERC